MTAIVFKRQNPRELSGPLAGKLIAIILALTLVLGLLMCGIDKAFAGSMTAPRADVLIKGEKIKLGDVFEGVTQNADFALAPAPGPGEELVWNKSTLLRIATAFNLPWQPTGESQIRIRSATMVVDADTLRTLVREHLNDLSAQSSPNESYNVSFTTDVPEIIVPNDRAPEVQLADLNMQPAGGTFTALVKVTGSDGRRQNVNLRGVADRMVRLPVVNADLRNGDIIRPEQISWVSERSGAVRKDAIRSADALIGSTPRKSLAAGEIVRADSIQSPRMVSRGDLITMVFSHGGMYLTVKGRALEDGAMGQSIKVSNTGSNRTIEARVTAAKEVTVN